MHRSIKPIWAMEDAGLHVLHLWGGIKSACHRAKAGDIIPDTSVNKQRKLRGPLRESLDENVYGSYCMRHTTPRKRFENVKAFSLLCNTFTISIKRDFNLCLWLFTDLWGLYHYINSHLSLKQEREP